MTAVGVKGVSKHAKLSWINPKPEKWRVGTLKAPCTLPNIGSIIKITTVRNRGYKVLDAAVFAVSIVFDYST